MTAARLCLIVISLVAVSGWLGCQSDVQQTSDADGDTEVSDRDTTDADPDGADGDTATDADVGGDGDTETGDMPDGDTRSNEDEVDPNCHYDCPTQYSCEDGVVYEHPAYIPCDQGGSEICESSKSERFQCAEGCFYERVGWFDNPLSLEPKQLCNEHRPRVVGDDCQTDDDCAPGQTVTVDGERQTKDLTCDADSNTCVDESAPDYLAFCDSKAPVESGSGYIEAPEAGFAGCDSAAYCVASAQADTICQSCTFECTEDTDCPSGSECRRFASLEDDQADGVRLCMPVDSWDQAKSFVECRATQ